MQLSKNGAGQWPRARLRNASQARTRKLVGASPSGSRETGGAEGSRTPDLLNANQALYQLSYCPVGEHDTKVRGRGIPRRFTSKSMVGRTGIAPVTPAL